MDLTSFGVTLLFGTGIAMAVPFDALAQRLTGQPTTTTRTVTTPAGDATRDLAAGNSARSWLFGADSGANDRSGTLLQIDGGSAASHVIGETGIHPVTDVAFTPDGRLYGVSFTHLLRINPYTGASHTIGSGIGFTTVNALVSDANGVLYSATTFGDFLRIDSATGVGTRIGGFGSGFASSGDLAFDGDGRLFGTVTTGSGSDLLVRVNPHTGRATSIGSIGFPDVFGLAFGPDGILYGAARGDEFSQPALIRISAETGLGVAVGNIPNSNGMFGFASSVRLAPVVGRLRTTGTENPDCINADILWTFCQHQTGSHRPLGGVQDSDDTYAWDVNLSGDADVDRPVFAVAPGKVVTYAGVIPPIGNESGAVLIEHSPDGLPCDTLSAQCWWSGYLHMRSISIVEGQTVTRHTPLGLVSHTSQIAIPDHLHFVVYRGANAVGALTSVDAVFLPRTTTALAAAVLPSGRAGVAGSPLTVFVTVINAGLEAAANVGIKIWSLIPALLKFYKTDPATNAVTGAANARVDIPAGALQTFLLEINPSSAFAPKDVEFEFAGSNTLSPDMLVGVNTLLLSASSAPGPDIVAVGATLTNDGIVNIPGVNGTGVFALATSNVGADALIFASVDSGGVSLPVNPLLCRTNSTTGACISAAGASVPVQINAGQTPTFTVFIQGFGTVPFDPGTNRVFVRFKTSNGTTVGSTSAALRTVLPPP